MGKIVKEAEAPKVWIRTILSQAIHPAAVAALENFQGKCQEHLRCHVTGVQFCGYMPVRAYLLNGKIVFVTMGSCDQFEAQHEGQYSYPTVEQVNRAVLKCFGLNGAKPQKKTAMASAQ